MTIRRLTALALAAATAAALAPAAPALAQRIADIQVAPRFVRLPPDGAATVTATAYDRDGNPLSDVRFQWRSTNINVVAVDSTGTVRAVGPGVAVVLAFADEAGRRRAGEATVFVMRQMPGPGPRGAPPPSPPEGRFPGPPPGGPPNRLPLDSATRASINCADPMINAVNPLRACWDVRAVVVDSTIVEPELPGPDKCPQGATPASLLIHIAETGAVTDVQPLAPSNCPEFTERAEAAARNLRFTPAQRDGRPVASWRVIRPRGRR